EILWGADQQGCCRWLRVADGEVQRGVAVLSSRESFIRAELAIAGTDRRLTSSRKLSSAPRSSSSRVSSMYPSDAAMCSAVLSSCSPSCGRGKPINSRHSSDRLPRSSLHARHAAHLCDAVHVCASVQQQPHDLHLVLHRGPVQQGRALPRHTLRGGDISA